jgi:hypothetical protein
MDSCVHVSIYYSILGSNFEDNIDAAMLGWTAAMPSALIMVLHDHDCLSICALSLVCDCAAADNK